MRIAPYARLDNMPGFLRSGHNLCQKYSQSCKLLPPHLTTVLVMLPHSTACVRLSLATIILFRRLHSSFACSSLPYCPHVRIRSSLASCHTVGGAWVWPFPALQCSILIMKACFSVSVHVCYTAKWVRAYNISRATLLSGHFFFCLVCPFLSPEKKKKNY